MATTAIDHRNDSLTARLVNIGSSGVVITAHLFLLAAPFVSASPRILIAALVAYVLLTLGIMGGYHRLLSHRSFKTNRVIQFVLAWLGCGAMQNGPLWWASSHRRHHRHSDQEGDPHSPVQKGFWYAHIGWVMDGSHDRPDLSNVKDLARFPELLFLDKWKWLPTITHAVVATLVFGLPGLVWIGAATALSFQAPLFVNSLGHMWGSRRFQTTDASRNNPIIGLLALGEGWHNNHHHAEGSAKHGHRWWEVDITWYFIWTLSTLRLAWNVRVPSREMESGVRGALLEVRHARTTPVPAPVDAAVLGAGRPEHHSVAPSA